MTRIGCTGHQDLTLYTLEFTASQLRQLLAQREELIGITGLAVGADQLFAQIVLDLGGTLEIVVAAQTYREIFARPGALALYDTLLAQAKSTIVLPFIQPSEEAFMEAGREVVRRSESLIAIWDGQPARGLGGTADVVEYAHKLGVPVQVIWPPGEIRK